MTQKAEAIARQRTAQLRATVAIGAETICGTVIEVRRSMVKIAAPVTMQGPNGQGTLWSRIDHLHSPGDGLCSYGL